MKSGHEQMLAHAGEIRSVTSSVEAEEGSRA
jgi:hypothetical protein